MIEPNFIYFYYSDKQPVLLGDRVRDIPDRLGTITAILVPQSKIAIQMNERNGGAFIDFDDGDKWLVANFDDGSVVLEYRNEIAPKKVKINIDGMIEY